MKKFNNKKEWTKLVVGWSTAFGISTIILYAVDAIVPGNIGKVTKITVSLGKVALGGMVGMRAIEYTDQAIDEVVEYYELTKEMRKEVKESLA